MFKYGLLLLSYRPKNLSTLLSSVGSYLKATNAKISKTLYISIDSEKRLDNFRSEFSPFTARDLITLVPRIYVEAHRYAPRLDVRVLHHIYYHNLSTNVLGKDLPKRKLQFEPEVIFFNDTHSDDQVSRYFRQYFDVPNSSLPIVRLDEKSLRDETPGDDHITDQVYDYVCLGGTFDHLHNGHKILLSTAQLKCDKSLTIGVTDENMVRNKTLFELIEKPEIRIEKLGDYLNDVDPYINYNIVKISDPFGPAIVDESLQSIIVSEETLRGGTKINEIRSEKGMTQLKVEVIKVLGDDHKESEAEEEKVSSSSQRMRKLGTLIKPPDSLERKKPYIVGLTGMIASGKSSISEKLRKLGAGIVNVDLLAHQCYRSPAAPAYKEIVDTFGKEVLDEEGNIDRPKLGKIVFDDQDKLNELNMIIWPKVYQLLDEEVEQMKHKYDVIVLEIALLIESNWIDRVDQVWLTVLNEEEAIRRLQDRNQLSREDAMRRVQSMTPGHEKVPYANVVFCTYWDESVTWQQVKRAWKMVNERFVAKS